MKKLFVLIVSVFALASCGEDVDFNSPAVQGNKDGNLWRANSYSAEVNANGQLVVTGIRGFELVVLKTASTSESTYTLGNSSSSEAKYIITDSLEYSTNNQPDESVQVYPADGEIVIDNFDASLGTVSGTFWYNAFTTSGLEKINFNRGVFFDVPIYGGSNNPDITSCDEASEAVTIAQSNYNSTDPTSPDFTETCNTYADALMTQINSCGDDNNVLQSIIDALNCDAGSGSGGGTIATCQTCTLAALSTVEYCNNNDGTVSATTNGSTIVVDLGGVSFQAYIQAIESGGYDCN